MNFWKELLDVINACDDETLKKALDHTTFKYSENGKTLIDIENGVDKLAEPKAERIESKTVDTPVYENIDPVEDSFVEEAPESEDFDDMVDNWISDNTLKLNCDSYILLNSVNGITVEEPHTEIVFAHPTKNSWVPGITDQQLIDVLKERFSDDPEKVALLERL